MKRVHINQGQIGLVFKNDDYQRFITAGKHWLGIREQVSRFDLTQPFDAPIALELLLKDEQLAALLTIVDVKDHELALVYKNDNLKEVLTPGRYIFWKPMLDLVFIKVDLSKIYITEKINKSVLNHMLLNRYIRSFEVATYEKALLMVDDVYVKTLGSGIYRFWRNEKTIKLAKADLRQLQLEITGQELLTKDKAGIRINFYAHYKITDIEKALLLIKDYEKQLYVMLQLALRAYIGKYTLDEILDRKDDIAQIILDEVKQQAQKIGIQVLNSGIRDVILPGEMKEIMNQVLVAQKRAQANSITRREETAATRSLLNTAKLMEENTMLYQLKEMEFVEKIADKIGEITVNGNGGMVQQLKDIFAVRK
ncbi:slipin family protein [Aquimarina rhabdastrellae]